MAKSKKNKKAADEEEIVEETEAEEEAEVEAADVDADEAETEVEADDAEADADVEAADAETEDAEDADADEVAAEDGDDDAGDQDKDEVEEKPSAPSPKITKTALVLIMLNWLAAPTFLYFVYQDHVARTQASYRTMANYVKMQGLPLKEEETFPSIATTTRPVNRLTPEQLDKAFKERRTGVSIGSDKFLPVEEEAAVHIRPSDMTEDVLKDVFWDVPNPVKTLDDEIERLKTAIPARISDAATEIADTQLKKPDAEKRKFVKDNLAISGDAAQIKALTDQIDGASGAALDDYVKRAIVQRTLFTMAFSVYQVDELDKKLNATKGADLDKLVNESLQRRMYYDILASINVYRPGEMSDPKKRFEIENLADQSVTLADLKRILEKRLDGSIAPQYLIDDAHLGKDFWNKGQPTEQAKTRDAIEKRKHIGFILFTLGQTHKPLLNTPLFDKGVERAQVISGLYDFTNASIEYVWTMARLEERVAQTIKTDRDGWMTLDKKRTPGYIDKIEQEIDNLVKIQQRIDIADKRLADVKKQRDQFNKIYEDRAMQYKEAVDRLLKERTKTENYAKQLRVLQDQLLNSLLELADAGERNYQIEAEIRAIELEYIRRMQSKGATKP